jgi:hypothetical protein
VRKIAIFTEGQSEQLFVRSLLTQIVEYSELSFECLSLYADQLQKVPFSYKGGNAKLHFMIVDVRGDTKVLSAIKEREKNLIGEGYEKIIGLRDLYSQTYQDLSPDVIDEETSRKIIDGSKSTIVQMTNPDKIELHFCIMELEAWFLSMYNLFKKMDDQLSADYIDANLGFNLKNLDPQREFYKPSTQLDMVFRLFRGRYTKSYNNLESICSKMESSDLVEANENGRCQALKAFQVHPVNEYA